MQELTRQDMTDLLYGCGVLGTGGGGSVEEGLSMMQEYFDAGKTLKLISLEELPDDGYVATPYGCGAPSVEIGICEENMKCAERKGSPAVLAFQALEAFMNVKFCAVSTTELGGSNTAEALHIACLLDLPLADGDPAGRSVPELIHSTYYLKKRPIAPLSTATKFGDVVILKEVADDFRAETLVRAMACVSGDEISVCDHPMTGKAYRECVIDGAISNALDIGRTLRKARENGADAAAAVAEQQCGAVLFRGVVKEAPWECRGGFDCGEILLDGRQDYEGQSCRIVFKNENLIAYRNGIPAATVPDLICMIDRNGNPVTNPICELGLEMTVIVLPAPKPWTTREGLAILGPKYFDIDEEYIPFDRRNR